MNYQNTDKDCGRASSRTLLRLLYKSRKYEAAYFEKEKMNNFLSIQNGLKKYGVDIKGYEVDQKGLDEIKRPFICQLKREESYHFVVASGNKRKLKIYDSSCGIYKINKKKSTKVYKNIPPIFPHNANMQIAKYIYKKDENFNLEKFLNWVKNIFLTLENAFSQRDWQKIFTFESKELFEEHNAQIQELISLGRVNIKDNINIIDAYLHKLVIDGNSENLTVSIRATMNNYIVDEASGSIITGKKEEVFDTIYQMTFVRTNGIKTTIINGESITKIEKSDWTLTKFEPVDNNFVDDISGIVFNNNNKF